MESVLKDLDVRMRAALDGFEHSLNILRVGRMSPAILDGILVHAYGTPTPIAHVASVHVGR